VIAGVDPKEVDILMGTFTKSFGSVGGYIAGDKVHTSPSSSSCALVPVCRRNYFCSSYRVIILISFDGDGQDFIRYLRQTSFCSMYEETMSIPCAQMIISALNVITGADGSNEGQKRFGCPLSLPRALADRLCFCGPPFLNASSGSRR
jgi:serine palmitoyltransferase